MRNAVLFYGVLVAPGAGQVANMQYAPLPCIGNARYCRAGSAGVTGSASTWVQYTRALSPLWLMA